MTWQSTLRNCLIEVAKNRDPARSAESAGRCADSKDQEGKGDWGKTAGTWSDDVNDWASNLSRSIDCHGVTLVTVAKNFYEECPTVRAEV